MSDLKHLIEYREHPAEFVEKYFGVKLTPYQKMILTKITNQSQVEITCWNRVNQTYVYALFAVIKTLNNDFYEGET